MKLQESLVRVSELDELDLWARYVARGNAEMSTIEKRKRLLTRRRVLHKHHTYVRHIRLVQL